MKSAKLHQGGNLDPEKLIKPDEIKRLRKQLSQEARTGGQRSSLRWLAIDLLLGSGLRVAEACNLQIKDCHVGYDESYIFVRNGKGGKSGTVIISEKLKKHIKRFIGDRIDGPLLISERGQEFSRRGLQKLVKRCFADCGLPERYSAHSCRHAFCSSIYRATQDLRLTQQQARHSNTQTTLIYTHLLNKEIQKGMEGIYE